ncbi:WG repeat-containing protein [Bacteroidota bacterium]
MRKIKLSILTLTLLIAANFSFSQVTQYDSVYEFKNGKAIVVKENQFGIIDTKGNLLTDSLYSYIEGPMENGYYKVCMGCILNKDNTVNKRNAKYGIINPNGKLITDRWYLSIGEFNKYGLAQIRDRREYAFRGVHGLIDTTGMMVSERDYSHIDYFDSHGKAVVTYYSFDSHEYNYNLVDRYGKQVNDIKYRYISRSNNGLYLLEKYPNDAGLYEKDLYSAEIGTIIEQDYSYVKTEYSFPTILVNKGGEVTKTGRYLNGGKWALLNEKAEVASDWYDLIEVKRMKYIRAKIGDKFIILHGYGDKKWRPVNSELYIETGNMNEQMIPVKKESGWGFITENGSEVSDFFI